MTRRLDLQIVAPGTSTRIALPVDLTRGPVTIDPAGITVEADGSFSFVTPLDPTDRALLDALAKAWDLPAAEVLRRLVREAHARLTE